MFPQDYEWKLVIDSLSFNFQISIRIPFVYFIYLVTIRHTFLLFQKNYVEIFLDGVYFWQTSSPGSAIKMKFFDRT